MFGTGVTVLLYSRAGRALCRFMEPCLWIQEQYANEEELNMSKEEAEEKADAVLKEIRVSK